MKKITPGQIVGSSITILLIVLSATMAWDGLRPAWGWFAFLAFFSGCLTFVAFVFDD